jgi:glycosyltransferase involved in cell wall biosynthesis
MKNRIIITASDFWYLWNFRLRLINELTLKGWDVILVSANISGFVKTDLVLPESVEFIDLKFQSHSLNLFREGLLFSKLLWVIVSSRPRVLLSFTPKMNLYTSLIALVLNVKLIANVSGQGSLKNSENFLTNFYLVFSKFLMSKTFHVFFQNEDDMRSMGLTGANFSLLPGSGVDIDKFFYSYQEAPRLKVFLACRLIKEKGVEDFLACASMFAGDSRIQFVLAGIPDFSHRSIPESVIYNCCSNVPNFSYVGSVDCIRDIANSCHVFVLPSFYAEGTPRFLLEGLSTGKIIVTTDSPGCRDTVCDNENGFLVDSKSPQKIMDALNSILAMSNDQRVSMSLKSRELAVIKYDERFVLDKYFDVLTRCK